MDEESEEVRRGDWYKSKVAARIPAKHRKTRTTAFVVLGALKVAGTGVRVAGRGVRDSRRRRRARRLPRRGSLCGACGVTFRTVAALNEHYRTVHVEQPAKREHPAPQKIRRPPGTARAPIRPADRRPANLGTVVASTTNPRNPRAEAAVTKYRSEIDELGKKAMSESTVAQALRQAARNLEDQNPKGRTEMNGQVAALEAGLLAIAEEIDGYAVRLKKPHPRGESVRGPIAPELVNPNFRDAREKLEEAAQALARFVATFEDVNALAIRAAKGELPNGGSKFLGN